jgi:hypothetical protein
MEARGGLCAHPTWASNLQAVVRGLHDCRVRRHREAHGLEVVLRRHDRSRARRPRGARQGGGRQGGRASQQGRRVACWAARSAWGPVVYQA